MPSPSTTEIIHTYRHLYRALLHAVQFSKPASFVVRDQLRTAFRREDPKTFNQQRISNTLDFLEGAAREKGLEHRILKNLIHVAYARAEDQLLSPAKKARISPLEAHLSASALKYYEMTLAMLNDSMGLCLR